MMRTLMRRAVAAATVLLLTIGGVLTLTAPASAGTVFGSTTAWSWVYQPLPATAGVDQAVSGRISGLVDKDKNGAFQLRVSSSDTFVRANFSGTRYQVSGLVGGAYVSYVDVPFVPGADGTARVELSGTVVRAYWNGALVDSHDVAALSSFTGTGTGLGIWQNVSSAVRISDAAAASLTEPAPAPAPSPTSFSSATVWSWQYAAMAATAGADQAVSGRISGLVDKDKNGAFQLRVSSSDTFVRANFSGTRYQVSGLVGGAYVSYVDVPFVPGADGTARVELSGTVVRAYWNGALVDSHDVAALSSFTGTGTGLGIWQNVSSAVHITDAVALSPQPPVTTPPLPVAGPLLSGASGNGVSSGAFGSWRGSAVQIAGTWNDSFDAQTAQYSVQPGAAYGSWSADLDVAVGGIYKSKGQSWAAAAAGAYDSRWTKAFQSLKRGWGSRTGTLWVRFAHEFNGDWMPWSVTGSEAGSFVTTWRRVYGILKSILPNAKMVFSPNDGSSRSLALDWRTAWPGAAYVDAIGVDSYNQYPYVNDATAWQDKALSTDAFGAPIGLERHRQFAESVGRPLALSEWGTNASMGDAAAYMQLMHDWIAAHRGTGPGQLAYEIYFNVASSFSGVFQIYPSTRQPQAANAYADLF